MSPHKLTLPVLTGILAGAMLLVAGTVVPPLNRPGQGTNSALPVISLQPGELVGNAQVVRAILKNGTNEFLFVVPEDVAIQKAEGGSILMSSRDTRYYCSVHVLPPAAPEIQLSQALQERIATDYPGASRLEDFATTVADHPGIGARLSQQLPGLTPQHVRILWVPFNAGLVEFTLATPSENLTAAQAAFDMILLTFRSNEQGKLEFVTRSDKS